MRNAATGLKMAYPSNVHFCTSPLGKYISLQPVATNVATKNDTLDDWGEFEASDLPAMLLCDEDVWIELEFMPNSIRADETDKGWGILRFDGTFNGDMVEDEEICFWAKKEFIALMKKEKISRKGKKIQMCEFRKSKVNGLNKAEFR